MRTLIALFLLAPAVLASAATNAEFRVWTSIAGARVDARLVQDRGAVVVLEKKIGGRVEIRPALLSNPDRVYLDSLRKPAATAPAAAAAPAAGDLKGLRLGMSRQDVVALEKASPWEFDQMGRGDPRGDTIQMQPQFLAERPFVNLDGSQSPTNAAVANVRLFFDKDVLYRIVFTGANFGMDEVARLLDRWLTPAAAVIEKSFGKPAATPRPLTTAKPNRDQVLAQLDAGLRRFSHWQYLEWKVGDAQSLILCASRERIDNTCAGQVQWVDNEIEKSRRIRHATR